MSWQLSQVVDSRSSEYAISGEHRVVEVLEELGFVSVLSAIHKPIAVEKTAFVVNHPNRVTSRRFHQIMDRFLYFETNILTNEILDKMFSISEKCVQSIDHFSE